MIIIHKKAFQYFDLLVWTFSFFLCFTEKKFLGHHCGFENVGVIM